jgi:uridine kinase
VTPRKTGRAASTKARAKPSGPVRFVGIAGGTASGKTSIARKLQKLVGEDRSVLIELDSYYRDLSHLPVDERAKRNFDHPTAFDFSLLHEHLSALKAGRSISVPVYDYVAHNRTTKTVKVEPRRWVLVEGILALWDPDVRALFEPKIYVEAPDDLRLLRRIRRDSLERGRELADILAQYEKTVRPAHLEFCEPTRVFADVIVPRGAENETAVEILRSYLLSED